MLLQGVIFVLGLGVLYLGADWLVRGASSLALRFGIRPLVVGLTVVALGTSMPEFLLNLFAILWEADGLAIGNIVGSNIANIALILGISAMILPLTVESDTLKREYPILLGATVLFWLLARDGLITRIDGGILVSGLAAFMGYLVHDARRRSRASERITSQTQDSDEHSSDPIQQIAGLKMTGGRRVVLLIAGAAFLSIGARLMISSAVFMAEQLGIDQVVVGLTVLAIGTSLPELAASILCAIRKDADMSVGNVIGSNLLNILFVVGLISLIRPLAVDETAISIHFPIMIGFTILLLPLAWTRNKISRIEGSILLAGFFGYMFYLIYPYL